MMKMSSEEPTKESPVSSIQQLLADAVIHKSSFEDIATIVQNGGDLNKPVVKGRCALHYAVYDNDTTYTKELIRLGASVHVTDDVGYTPLHICAQHGHRECMQILLQNGAFQCMHFCAGEPALPDSSQIFAYHTKEPLNLAIENNKTSCVQLLLENSAKINDKHFLCHEINKVPLEHLNCLELLLKFGADPNVCAPSELNILMRACKEQNEDAMKLLINYGADVNLSSDLIFEEKTPLYYAIMGGNVEIVKILVENGVDLRRQVARDTYPLTLAVSRDKLDISQYLLDNGADVNEINVDGVNPLITVCTTTLCQQFELMELLLDRGADPNSHMTLVSHSCPLLLEQGADPNSHMTHVSHSCPSLAPIVEYFVHNDDINPYIIHKLIKYGARVALCEATTPTSKIVNPFGIVGHLHKFAKFPGIFNLILQAVEQFDISTIKRSNLTLDKQQHLIMLATTPFSLKQIVRFKLRRLLQPVLPRRVALLPIPELLKKYLLYDANIEYCIVFYEGRIVCDLKMIDVIRI